MAKVYAISVKQPWAALLIAGRKTVEIRSWNTRIRGRILIHAARVPDPRPEAWKWVTDEIRTATAQAGGIIGTVELSDSHFYANSTQFTEDIGRHLNEPSWFQPKGLYGFVFRNPVAVPFRPVLGNVRFFTVEEPA